MAEPVFSVPLDKLIWINPNNSGAMWACRFQCAGFSGSGLGSGQAPSVDEAASEATKHLAVEHDIRRVSIVDCIDLDDPRGAERANRMCDDMAGPHGVGGPCVHLAGHPHEDGIGGEWS